MIGKLLNGGRCRVHKVRDVAVEFFAEGYARNPRTIGSCRFVQTLAADRGEVRAGDIFARRLAEREVRLAVAKTERDYDARIRARDEIVEKRKLETARAAGVKCRLKREEAGE